MFARLRRIISPMQSKNLNLSGLATACQDLVQHPNENLLTSVDPYSYTNGRWLKNDGPQREARYIKFDFQALCKKAIDVCPGANEIIGCEKKEGAFNRVFILQMDNGHRVVARVPFRVAGPRRLVTNSEVATMAYVRANSKVPVPKVLDWSDDDTNPTNTEYIIMEHVSGVQLHQKWPSMNTHQHMLCVKSLVTLVKELTNLSFPAYGSLYFADAPIDSTSKIGFVKGFCIGPHCGAPIWPCGPLELPIYDERMPNPGPWTDLQSYCSGLIEAGLLRVPNVNPPRKELDFRGSVQEHLRLIKASDKVIKELIECPIIQNIAIPTLLHPDLHKRNIYVSDGDPTVITALIDWQSAGVDPIFTYAYETPDLITSALDIPPSLTELKTSTAGEHEDPEKEKSETDASICRQTFEIATRGWIPKLHEARVADDTFLRILRYCSSSWIDGAAALRQELIELSQRWTELGLPGSCPYAPSQEELAIHKKQFEDYEASLKLKLFLVHATDSNSDGWVAPDAWDSAREAHKAAFEEWMRTVKEGGDPDMTEEKARKLWPFDVDW